MNSKRKCIEGCVFGDVSRVCVCKPFSSVHRMDNIYYEEDEVGQNKEGKEYDDDVEVDDEEEK